MALGVVKTMRFMSYFSDLTKKSNGDISVMYASGRTLIFEKSRNRYQYDENLYISRINYADGSYERFTYDERGNRTMVRARSGYATQYSYDARGNMTSVTDALGNMYTFTYDADGNMTGALSPLGSKVEFTYDSKGNLLKTSTLLEDGSRAETSYSYDAKGRVVFATDAEGGTTAFTYGSNSQPLSATGALGGTVKYTYDTIGRRTAAETDLGKTVYEYNNQDQITGITAPDGGVTKFMYDAIGNLTKLILPEQVEEAVEAGLSMEEAKGYTYTYDSMDRLIASGTPEEAVSTLGYDIDGNVTEQGMPEYAGYTVEDTESYRYIYDLVGNVTKVTAPDGGITTYEYDASNRLIRTEEEVQVDVLDMQENSVNIRPLEEGFEENGKGFLYMKQGFACEVVAEFEEKVNDAEIIVIYEDELLELAECTESAYGVTADTSVPGVIRLSVSGGVDVGEAVLCSLSFTAKTSATGTAYVVAAPESFLTNNAGMFAFSECTGVLVDICLPDYNGDSLLDLRDFTLLAKQHGRSVDENTEQYDLVEDGTIDDADLDYLRDFLFEGITEAEPVENAHVADKTVQAAYTITSTMETRVTATKVSELKESQGGGIVE